MSAAFVLVAICLPVILLSLEADAQPTTDESTSSCGSSMLDDVVNFINTTAFNQRHNSIEIKNEIRDLKNLLALATFSGAEPSKQPLVSTLLFNCVPLLIQQNVDGSNFFHRSWAEFKVGFNGSNGNYWLGNELLSQLTPSDRFKVRCDLQSRTNNNWYYAEYTTFKVLSEADSYRLQVTGYSGNAGNALAHSNDMKFTTHDRDNDRWAAVNCAVKTGGGFWHKNCAHADVNSNRNSGLARHKFSWQGLPGGDALQSTLMWLKCK